MLAPNPIQTALVRPAPPATPWHWSQAWLDLLFAHWKTPAEALRPLVPPALEVDTRGGAAWVSVVAFRLAQVRPRWLPAVGPLSHFVELNLRTYVRYQGEPAIYFLNIQAASRLVVQAARWLTPLPYTFATMTYNWRGAPAIFAGGGCRAEFTAAGPQSLAASGTDDEWLLERYALYVAGARGRLFRTVVVHPCWPVQSVTATINATALGEASELDLRRLPDRMHFSAGVQAQVWPFVAIQ